MERYSRRDILKAAGAMTLAVAAPAGLEVARREIVQKEKEPKNLTYEKALGDAIHFSNLLGQIPDEKRVGIKNQEDLLFWTAEIVPYFEYEKIDAETDEINSFGGGLQYPTSLHFEDYMDGLMSHHVLGRTQVFTNEVDLNARMANPVSPWYGREDSIGTLVHELAHAQGIKFPAPDSQLDEESSAQLVTLEVLSAMVNHGNELVVPALVDELRYMNMQAARFIAIRDGYEDQFLEDRDRILTTPFERSAARKADRQWSSYEDEKKYPYILEAYNYRPMDAVYRGMRHDNKIYGVKLPLNWIADTFNDNSSSASYYPEPEPEPYEPGMYANALSPEPLIIDDLHYFYDHAEELVKAL